MRPWIGLFFIFLLLIAMGGCGSPTLTIGTSQGRSAIVDATNLQLTRQDCDAAIEQIKDLYNSGESDNSVRLVAASAYACKANVNFLKLLNSILENAGALGGAGIWSLFTKLFPSTTNDRVVEAAGLSMDALMSVLAPGVILTSTTGINTGGYNPGSTLPADRNLESNFFLFFVSMAAIGGAQNRYGSPNTTNYQKTVPLPWVTAALVTSDGCHYASSILNFIDSVGAVSNYFTGSLGDALKSIKTAFTTGFDAACAIGCTNVAGGGLWGVSGCTATSPCSSCPRTLRDRTRCTGATTDMNSCAAAGIVNFINFTPTGWLGP